MSNEEKIAILEERNRDLRDRIELLEFKFELLFDNSESCRYFIERNFSREQYNQVMDLMDLLREKIDRKEKVSSIEYESRITQIKEDCDYHDAEIIAKLFMEEGRWEEVFPALYGDSIKYKSYFEHRYQGGNGFAD